MTEASTSQEDGVLLEETLEQEPFLRITSSYPLDNERFHTIELSMHVSDTEDLGGDGTGDGASVRSWFVDLCTAVIREMRAGPQPRESRMDGIAVPVFFASRLKHADDCDRSCGIPGPDASGAPGADAADADADDRAEGEQ